MIKLFLSPDNFMEAAAANARELSLMVLDKQAQLLERSLKKEAPEGQTGKLRGSIHFDLSGLRADFFSNKVGMWLTQGTGMWGPSHSPIRPKHAKALHFTIDGQEFFRKSVKGINPEKHDFRQPALRDVSRDERTPLAEAVAEWWGRYKP